MALSTASNWTWNFCIGFFTPFIFSTIDFLFGYVFAACNLAGGLLVYFFVLETRNRSLEEVDTMYLERVVAWRSERWEPPSAEDMARIRKRVGIDVEADAPGSGGPDEADARRRRPPPPPGEGELPRDKPGSPGDRPAHREHV